ncbi:MAG: glycosyltransferase [Saprospiraceae bacterium]|nr:glycosyltransferase [Saprospiraceae bacterium]
MRLLLLTPGFAASEQDFTCIPPMQLYVRAMQARDFDIQIVAFEYPFRDTSDLWHGARVVSANGQNRRWLRWRTWSRVRRYADQIIQTDMPHVIHSFWLGPAWVIGEKLSRKWSIPHWTTLMGQDARASNRYLRRLHPNHIGRLVGLSAFHAAEFYKNTGYEIPHLIPWGVDPTETPSTLPSTRPLDVLGVGSLIGVKNWEKWLHTLSILNTWKPGIRAALIGEGPLRKRLEQQAATHGLSGQVQFLGGLDRPEVLAYMQTARVLLHTSSYESFGFVLPEAAQNGCRLVSTPVGIGPEMAHCGDTPEQLARLVLEALQKPLNMKPLVPYDIEKAADAYQRLF